MSGKRFRTSHKFGSKKQSRKQHLRKIADAVQPSEAVSPGPSNVEVSTASIEKLSRYEQIDRSSSSPLPTADISPSCVIVEVDALSSIIGALRCSRCSQSSLNLNVRDIGSGIVTSLEVFCSACEEVVTSSPTSGKLDDCNPTQSPYNLYRRITTAMMEMGVGYAGLQKFTSIMGMPTMHHRTFVRHSKAVGTASAIVAQNVISDAAAIVRERYMELNPEILKDEVIDISVSYDGTWMKRGHTSNYGVGICADLLTDLVLDFEVLSKYVHSKLLYTIL